MDVQKMEAGFRMVLEAMGVNLADMHLKDTPRRTAESWAEELCVGMKEDRPDFDVFPVEEGYPTGLVALDRIPVKSICAHHMLPFVGEAVVAYVPGPYLCGLSKLSRVVNHFARRLQLQEHLTHQIAGFLQEHLQPVGVGVLIRATHHCMEVRGVNHSGSMTTTALLGSLQTDPVLREELLRLNRAEGSP
ncbi:MAG TPA: GTP cyclohydrolase I [bacterium]